VRVIYFTRLAEVELCMLLAYPKAERNWKMASRKQVASSAGAEALGRKLLQSVCKMKPRNFERVTEAPIDEVIEACQNTGLS
jgi:hypothetical protein